MSCVKEEARAFMIWREARSVGWRCTVRELADATGLAYKTVYRIVRARKWLLKEPEEDPVTPSLQVDFLRNQEKVLGEHHRHMQGFYDEKDEF